MVSCVSKTRFRKKILQNVACVLVEYGFLRFKERFIKSFNIVFAVVEVGWAIRNIRVRIRLRECRVSFCCCCVQFLAALSCVLL